MTQPLNTLLNLINHIISVHKELAPHVEALAQKVQGKPISATKFNNEAKNRFEQDKQKFINAGGQITHNYPIYTDFNDTAGVAKGHYFHQDLLVASYIFKQNPKKHLDIGSRVDGFVAHVAAFRQIEICDIRPLNSSEHENIAFKKIDLTDSKEISNYSYDSISCLHAIEHFGLGRYGDNIDPNGHTKGLENIINILEKGGTLYISFPIAESNQVHFNAHRVFHPHDIFRWTENMKFLKLVQFDYVDDAGNLHKSVDLYANTPMCKHGCGIYTFVKI